MALCLPICFGNDQHSDLSLFEVSRLCPFVSDRQPVMMIRSARVNTLMRQVNRFVWST